MNNLEKWTSKSPKYKETVLIIPNYDGVPKNFRLHARVLNDLGLNVAIMELKNAATRKLLTWPLSKDKQFGLRHKWADQIKQVLEDLERPLVLFSFSHPSCAALEVLADQKTKGFSAWITDGGPFFELFKSYNNLLKELYKIDNFPLRAAMTLPLIQLIAGPHYKKDMHNYLEAIPPHFPILNVKTWKDKLVSTKAIDEVFRNHDHLHLQTLNIPEAGHLEGLMKDPRSYTEGLKHFFELNLKPLV